MRILVTPARRWCATALLAIFLIGFPSADPAQAQRRRSNYASGTAPLVPFDRLAEAFATRHDLVDAERSPRLVDEVLARAYVRVDLGVFEVWHPHRFLRERKHATRFEEVAGAVLDLQEEWVAWVTAQSEGDERDATDRARGDLDDLRRWIRSWSPSRLGKPTADATEGPDLLVRLDAKPSVVEAAHRFATWMREGRAIGRHDTEAAAIRLVLSPTREDFLEFGSFVGSLDDRNRRVLWQEGLSLWTSFHRGDLHALALEDPASVPGQGDITLGFDMNAREKTGLLQHVVQHATDLLLRRFDGEALPDAIRNGLAMDLVIDLLGENNARSGGGTQGNSTAAQSRFVAGGNPSGGRLAARNADPRWRHEKGRDRFVGVLREAQRAGAKEARRRDGPDVDPTSWFELHSDSGSGQTHLVRAPFLVTSTEAEPIPDDFQNDALEFGRAYRCAFAYWLRTEAEATEGTGSPEALVARLLRATGDVAATGTHGDRSASRNGAPSFDELVLATYGRPLAADDPEADSLESDFLRWLARRR